MLLATHRSPIKEVQLVVRLVEKTIDRDASAHFGTYIRATIMLGDGYLHHSLGRTDLPQVSTHLLPCAGLRDEGWFGVKESKSPKGSALANVLPGRPNGSTCFQMNHVGAVCETHASKAVRVLRVWWAHASLPRIRLYLWNGFVSTCCRLL